MRKITKLAFVAASASMLFVSCQKDSMISEGVADLQRPIEVNPVTGFEGTKSAIYGSTMPFDRNLVISAAYKPEADRGVVGPDESKNYFQGVTFAYNASKKTWSSDDNPVYWPLTGSLDFLAYSTDDAQIEAEWNTTWSENVTLSKFKPADFYSDDLLYGVAQNSSPSTTAVPIIFKHAKALIVFTAKASYDEAIKIKKIELLDTKTAGVDTEVTLPYSDPSGISSGNSLWTGLVNVTGDSETLKGIDDGYTVPRTKIDVTKKSGYLGIGGEGIMLAPQAMTKIKVTFSQQYKGTGPSPVNGNEIEETFTYDCKLGLADGAQNWEAGKRYIYELDFRVNEINVVASVDPWQDAFGDNNPYVIDIPEVANYTGDGLNSVAVNLASGTKFIFDNGNGVVNVYTNNYQNAPVGTTATSITLLGGKTAKFYVSEGGKVEVTISGDDNVFIGKVFDTDKFVVKYEVKFDLGDSFSSNRYFNIAYRDGTNIDNSETTFGLHVPPRTGYAIEGWYKDYSCTEGNKWDFDNDKVTKALTLYAKWEEVSTP